jgi:hypothetical protein
MSSENKKETRFKILIAIMVGLSFWSFDLYKRTIIELKTVLLIILIAGVLVYLINQTHFFTRGIKQIKFIGLLKSIFIWGIIVCSSLIILNYYIHSDKFERKTFELESTRGANKEKGVIKSINVQIKYDDKLKELKFHKKHYKNIRKYKSVTLDITTGLFGFEVIKKQELN